MANPRKTLHVDRNYCKEKTDQSAQSLKSWADGGKSSGMKILMMFTDAEKATNDGYELTAAVRKKMKECLLYFICSDTSLMAVLISAMSRKLVLQLDLSLKIQPDFISSKCAERMREDKGQAT